VSETAPESPRPDPPDEGDEGQEPVEKRSTGLSMYCMHVIAAGERASAETGWAGP
jgi:hypothetical protein